MNMVLRVLPLALGNILAAGAAVPSATQSELPPIFAKVDSSPATPPPAPSAQRSNATPGTEMSEHMREQIASILLTRAVSNPSNPAAVDAEPEMTDIVKMDRYVVNVVPEQRVGLVARENPLYRAIKTGTLHEFRDAKGIVTSQIDLHVLTVQKPGTGDGKDFTRTELAFRLKW